MLILKYGSEMKTNLLSYWITKKDLIGPYIHVLLSNRFEGKSLKDITNVK